MVSSEFLSSSPETGLDGADGNVEDLCDLVVAEFFPSPQQDHFSMRSRELIETALYLCEFGFVIETRDDLLDGIGGVCAGAQTLDGTCAAFGRSPMSSFEVSSDSD